tara:strand:+ start:106 stop:927 length:822 start_codon:yes stop_codon:yes gene_type:complete
LKLALIGTGMIGSSFAVAARRRDLFATITGLDTDEANLAIALDLGVVDQAVEAVPEDADFVLLACPSDQVAGWVVKLDRHAGVVFDVGSIKAPIVEAIRDSRGSLPARFVPSHPVAGSEHSGPQAARAELFEGASVVITPGEETDEKALHAVSALWQSVGAVTHVLTPAQHDAALAVTSHLPHLLAFAYVESLPGDLSTLAGPGFRDFTRIAASNPDMWQRIFRMNRGLLLAALDTFHGALDELERALRDRDDEQLSALIADAAKRRRKFSAQ